MMIQINYTIEFLSDWMCSSGLGAGAETDNEVIKDKHGLPYIPGRTVKGLLRDAMEDMAEVEKVKASEIEDLFGKKTETDGAESIPGVISVGNATLSDYEKNEIIAHNMKELLYRRIASTAINEKGIALDKSLRVSEVCIPLTLVGSLNAPEEYKALIENSMKWIRRIGTNRNRGLGRCIITPK